MKLGLYMATQWRQGADLGPERLRFGWVVQVHGPDISWPVVG